MPVATHRCAWSSGVPAPGRTTKYVTSDLVPKNDVSRKLIESAVRSTTAPLRRAGEPLDSFPGWDAPLVPVAPVACVAALVPG
jgi:hypothetical protein